MWLFCAHIAVAATDTMSTSDDALIGAINIINTVPAGTRYSYYYTVQYDTRLVTRLPGSGTGTVATVATLV